MCECVSMCVWATRGGTPTPPHPPPPPSPPHCLYTTAAGGRRPVHLPGSLHTRRPLRGQTVRAPPMQWAAVLLCSARGGCGGAALPPHGSRPAGGWVLGGLVGGLVWVGGWMGGWAAARVARGKAATLTASLVSPVLPRSLPPSHPPQVCGEAQYVDDVRLPAGSLHAKLVLSTRPHAKILKIGGCPCTWVVGASTWVGRRLRGPTPTHPLANPPPALRHCAPPPHRAPPPTAHPHTPARCRHRPRAGHPGRGWRLLG